ncbi:NAD(P)-dependent oxidoreductase [Ensifer adhaerens]|uniref:NAD-dependent epimerase/dehydratase family protein n=1 Tax=Ensifer adhaerens TaxID=106592 RepID=UPI001CC0BC3F|nr:NAD(P)-dependent oxidoreductase [Ensifer adhaerens]MBZ7924946.1 NAD(P)-dependent oxidoreductase [Ensifer adhaerens]UAX95844.1 NAD(P)-dependent oxidoreductase [Ensifer adhaerens]UAY04814.1 NAD(P)-dependent oxidoreductase [Ensifer adhaerens]UAY10246.1 NAD(P)-dependent oxidoreductase [Ensifer adhaerens]
MSLLVTGGHGFVMSNLVRAWLQKHPSESVTLLDTLPPDEMAERFFRGVKDRIRWIVADLRDRGTWFNEALSLGIDRIVHGAAVTPHAWFDGTGARHDPERENPERVLDVNLGGTLAVLAFARELPACRRFLLVSTGSVYGDDGPDGPLPEEGYVAPTTLYGVSKLAAEMVARRYGELYDLPVVTARLSSVFGPMDRMLPSRHVACAPNRMTALALAGNDLRLNSTDGVGDWVAVQDVAVALALLVEAERPLNAVYNIASGVAVSLGTLVETVERLVPGLRWSVDPSHPNVVAEPSKLRGQWGAYDISRLGTEFGWTPLPLEQRLQDYIEWQKEFIDKRTLI